MGSEFLYLIDLWQRIGWEELQHGDGIRGAFRVCVG